MNPVPVVAGRSIRIVMGGNDSEQKNLHSHSNNIKLVNPAFFMKKVSAILLLGIYLFTQLGAIAWYYYKPIAHTYFKNLESKELVSLTIGESKLKELQAGDNELKIDGILYDVEELTITNAMAHLILKKDKAETNWDNHYQSISNLLQKHSKDKSPVTEKIPDIFFAFYSVTETKTTLSVADRIVKTHRIFINSIYSSPLLESLSRPPEIA